MNIQPIFDYVFYINFANKVILKFVISYHILQLRENFFFCAARWRLLMQPEHVAVTMRTTCCADGWFSFDCKQRGWIAL